jgi:uncharacterized RDD family membrane protein YckC
VLDITATAPAAPVRGDEMRSGMRLDHFRIERRLGAGGMGEVYLATDLALDRPVAIKVLPAGSSSGTAHDRLIREARAQARVHHANVAHIYFIGEDQGRLYFAMEYVEGETLADKIARGPLSVEAALAVVRSAALGLQEAQTHGFTHRDVKPSNLMVDKRGTLKVLDFGLVTGGGKASDGPVQQTTLAGTPLYMAPEQARGEAIDLRADIYALGATLYHLVSGKPPYVADSVEQLMTLHHSAARPALVRKGVPRTQIKAIDALVARMMAPDPADRFASYDELLRAIELASSTHTRPAGFWVRGCSFAIDMFLVLLFIAFAKIPIAADRPIPMGLVGLPLLAAVNILCLRRWGATPGMALFELEVASVDGGRPSWKQVFVRTAVLGAAPVALANASELSGPTLAGEVVSILELACALVLGGLTLRAALIVPGKIAPWDRVAGTIVRYRTTRSAAG